MLKQLIWYHSTEKKNLNKNSQKIRIFALSFLVFIFAQQIIWLPPWSLGYLHLRRRCLPFFFLRCCTRCQRKPIQTKNAGNFSCCCSNHIGALIYVVCSFLFWTFGFFTLLSFYAALSRWQSALVASLFGGMAGWLVSVVGGDRCAP